MDFVGKMIDQAEVRAKGKARASGMEEVVDRHDMVKNAAEVLIALFKDEKDNSNEEFLKVLTGMTDMQRHDLIMFLVAEVAMRREASRFIEELLGKEETDG